MATLADVLLQDAEALLQGRDVDRAVILFNAAEEAGAAADRCAGGCWLAYMLAGEFEAAWLQSDAIRSRGAEDPHRFWNGQSIEGRRVILRCLHGMGDAVQMLRYVPMLRSRASKLIVETEPRFFELAAKFDGVDEVVTWGARAPASPPCWDVQMELMELPYFFRTQLSELPMAERYLRLPRAGDLDGAAGALRVGLVWASGSWDPLRSVPLKSLLGVLQQRECEFWILQGGSGLADAETLAGLSNVRMDPLCADSPFRLAQVISEMDLVITPDTLAAHLAGAQGVTTWVMLPRVADWRWMMDREDSPWYPTLRLFRQPVAGDWKSVIDRMERELNLLLDQRQTDRWVA